MGDRGGPVLRQSRRRFVQAAAGAGLALAGGALLAGCTNTVAPLFAGRVGDQLETTRIRLSQIPGICVAPQYIATDLLKAEGFTDVEYVKVENGYPYPAYTEGRVDIGMAFVAPFIVQLDAGDPIVLLGGVHAGCYELFGTDSVRAIRDLKGKTVGVPSVASAHQLFISSMAAYVGLDPKIDINWLVYDAANSAQVLTDGTVDALVGFPPVPQELRAKNIGHVVVSSANDHPWSQYFCCTLAANRVWAQQHPVAAKRSLRAILKATDICATEPERVARYMVDEGFTPNYSYALQTVQEVAYNHWREYDPEDSVRFYALLLREVDMIKLSPDRIVSQGTDWRFFSELKQELKG